MRSGSPSECVVGSNLLGWKAVSLGGSLWIVWSLLIVFSLSCGFLTGVSASSCVLLSYVLFGPLLSVSFYYLGL